MAKCGAKTGGTISLTYCGVPGLKKFDKISNVLTNNLSMSKVLTFSQYFPSYHPQRGEKTFFIERIWKGLNTKNIHDGEYTIYSNVPRQTKNGNWQIPVSWRDLMNDETFFPKFHTIRAGYRWKAGEKFSPRVWSGQPYNSKQIIIAPDTEIIKTWKFEMKPKLWFDECEYYINGKKFGGDELEEVAKNDGLSIIDFACWFAGKKAASSKRKPFEGQVICWDKNINY